MESTVEVMEMETEMLWADHQATGHRNRGKRDK
jgi:hypothetical protein